eukprot:4100069-Ditylum_brightwellii.AAC.1
MKKSRDELSWFAMKNSEKSKKTDKQYEKNIFISRKEATVNTTCNAGKRGNLPGKRVIAKKEAIVKLFVMRILLKVRNTSICKLVLEYFTKKLYGRNLESLQGSVINRSRAVYGNPESQMWEWEQRTDRNSKYG